MAALGLTGAEIVAATPAMGAMAGAGLGTGASIATALPEVAPWVAEMGSGAEALQAGGELGTGANMGGPGMSQASPSWFDTIKTLADQYMPSKSTIRTTTDLATLGNIGKGLLTPPKPPTAPVPSISSGRTGSYTPTTNAPIQSLANMIAQRRQATAGRRFA